MSHAACANGKLDDDSTSFIVGVAQVAACNAWQRAEGKVWEARAGEDKEKNTRWSWVGKYWCKKVIQEIRSWRRQKGIACRVVLIIWQVGTTD